MRLPAVGKLDPVIGRDEEIRRVLQILSRRTKNNPILIGEPEVQVRQPSLKVWHTVSFVVTCPKNLKNKQIYSLDMGALVAGPVHR